MSKLTRRRFLQSAVAVTAGFAGLRMFGALAAGAEASAGYGPLVPDPEGVFDLPDGFRYRVISQIGQRMDDGLLVPGQPDGMGTFLSSDGMTIIVRNHELNPAPKRKGAFGWHNELLDRVDRAMLFNPGNETSGGEPCLGGTTTLVYDTKKQQLVSQHLSLAGTWRNCAGGVTPWGSWITCEEPVNGYTDNKLVDGHGWNFEVPASAKGLVQPEPIRAMGRFNHEAIAVDPDTGIVYQTEDVNGGMIYRYIPAVPGELHRGGRLQALALIDLPACDTRNNETAAIAEGQVGDVKWIDLDDIESPHDDLREQGFSRGAAIFARCEGMWYGKSSIYFAATSGGPNKQGQIWRYVPSRMEGQPDETRFPGRLELFLQPVDHDLVQNCDNVTIAPWGDVVICEDSKKDNGLTGLTPDGKLYPLGFNQLSDSELAGVCFSPDGSTLFVNIQGDGITLAVTGPWRA